MSDEGEELRAIGVVILCENWSICFFLPLLWFFPRCSFLSFFGLLCPFCLLLFLPLFSFFPLFFLYCSPFIVLSSVPFFLFLFPLKLQQRWGAFRDSQNLRKVLDITLFCKCIVHGLPPGKFVWVLLFPLHDNTCKKGIYIYIAWLSQPEKIWFGLPAKINYEKHVQYNAASAGTANAILDVI